MEKFKWNTPIEIGGHRIKNRIVFPPINTNWAGENGEITDKIINFYRETAAGGCGMIVVSGTAVSPDAKSTDRSLCLYDGKYLIGFMSLAESIKNEDCFTAIQLMHVGGQGNPNFTGHIPVSPSGVRCMAIGVESAVLSIDEIADIRKRFIDAAKLAALAGFDAVELHLAHGYLLHEFLSAHTNKRNDIYGGNLSNRARLILEIIKGIRAEAPDIIVGARVSGEDFIRDGINENINRGLLPVLQEAGIEYFSVTAGIYDTSMAKHEAMSKGSFFDYARGIKGIVKKTVIGVGKVLDLITAENYLRKGNCDMVAIGRGLIADPMMVKKAINNREFNRCVECGQCQFLRHGTKYLTCSLRKL